MEGLFDVVTRRQYYGRDQVGINWILINWAVGTPKVKNHSLLVQFQVHPRLLCLRACSKHLRPPRLSLGSSLDCVIICAARGFSLGFKQRSWWACNFQLFHGTPRLDRWEAAHRPKAEIQSSSQLTSGEMHTAFGHISTHRDKPGNFKMLLWVLLSANIDFPAKWVTCGFRYQPISSPCPNWRERERSEIIRVSSAPMAAYRGL